MTIEHLFVYGTLRPGEVRWPHLEPFVIGDGLETSTNGALYDTGKGYPAAVFAGTGGAATATGAVAATITATTAAAAAPIIGRAYRLRDIDRALALLDDVESAVDGLYARVVVRLGHGVDAWAYECGDRRLLRQRIVGGDWLHRNS